MRILLKTGFFIALMSLSAVSSVVFAADAEDQDIKDLRNVLSLHLPQAAAGDISRTPVKGVYQFMSGSRVMYMTKDARYIFDGDLVDLHERRNLTEELRGTSRKKLLDALGEKNMLVYAPEGKAKHHITVFTDIYCPYCRKLHNEMNQYMAAGVKVRYMFLPFKGKRTIKT